MFILSKKPNIGIKVVMMLRVAWSVISFFSAFSFLLLSFWAVFHILLPKSQSFGALENSFIKVFGYLITFNYINKQVLAMLMGEFDFTTNFVRDAEAPFLAKIFFLVFLLLMGLIFMNLLLGLAVSDIAELERISSVSLRESLKCSLARYMS